MQAGQNLDISKLRNYRTAGLFDIAHQRMIRFDGDLVNVGVGQGAAEPEDVNIIVLIDADIAFTDAFQSFKRKLQVLAADIKIQQARGKSIKG